MSVNNVKGGVNYFARGFRMDKGGDVAGATPETFTVDVATIKQLAQETATQTGEVVRGEIEKELSQNRADIAGLSETVKGLADKVEALPTKEMGANVKTTNPFDALVEKGVISDVTTDQIKRLGVARKKLFQRCVRMAALDQLTNSSGRDSLASWAKSGQGSKFDKALHENYGDIIQHNGNGIVVKAQALDDLVLGGALANVEMGELVPLFQPAGVVRELGARSVIVTEGSGTIPQETAAGTANYVGENDESTLTTIMFGELEWNLRELVAVTAISKKLLASPSADADAAVTNSLERTIGARQDLAFLRGDGTNSTPMGFLNWLDSSTNYFKETGTTEADVLQALADMWTLQEENNIPTDGRINWGWVMAPRTKNFLMNLRNADGHYTFREEMNMGQFQGRPYRSTSQLPKNITYDGTANCAELMLMPMDYCAIFERSADNLMINTYSEATFKDSGGNDVSMAGRRMVAVQGTAEHDFSLTYRNAGAVLYNTWGV